MKLGARSRRADERSARENTARSKQATRGSFVRFVAGTFGETSFAGLPLCRLLSLFN